MTVEPRETIIVYGVVNMALFDIWVVPIFRVEQCNNIFASPGGITEASLWFNKGLLKDHCDKYVFGVIAPERMRFERLILVDDLTAIDNSDGCEGT
jgi:hypothetical protein